MERTCHPLAALTGLLYLVCLLHGDHAAAAVTTTGTADGSELWGYVQVRPKAHLFWWYYKSPQRASSPAKPWPTILWLHGGPGGSGAGRGNFLEVGPLDVNLKPRNSTWLQKADLIFVDFPVGVGYSYADDPSALVTTDLQAAADGTGLLKALAKEIPALQKEGSPLFLVGESYGGKLAAMIGLSAARAIHAGQLKFTLGGVVLGDSWISPEDFALTHARLLQDVSRLDDNAVGAANKMAATVQAQIAAGQFGAAEKSWTDLLDLIDSKSGSINIFNFLLDTGVDSMSATSATGSSSQLMKYSTYLDGQPSGSESNTIGGIMNGVIKQKLKIIPNNVVWQAASTQVFDALVNNFMKPSVNEVDQLLSCGVNVTVYNGQLDVICPTIGVEAWVQKLTWVGLKNFLSLPRHPLHYCDSSKLIKAFVRSYENLHFYWILEAGHSVPVDQPCVALNMIGSIIQSPAS
ncbi:hypothetical protein GUJ93_ZPchr0003g16742 [Zizania palustris]|uniref:Carboxypeptidase n=1 Tax=Zizania palustris TaxID=103762 RepID=A0A8J5VXS5_ZIZPA|nr:hypothetical protein GUJ93_ZPchr0003g16742 [Zizania palustris]